MTAAINRLFQRSGYGANQKDVVRFSSVETLYIADIAQLVEHQLPKLRVAGPNPVVRSSPIFWKRFQIKKRPPNGLITNSAVIFLLEWNAAKSLQIK